MRNFIYDLRHGIRLLATNLGFTLVATLTVALGIASTTTVFSWVEGLLNRPYPGVEDSGRLAALEAVTPGAPTGATRISFLDYLAYRDQMKLVSGLLAHQDDVFSVGDAGDGQPVWGETVSVNYFDVLRVPAVLGRTFSARECGDAPGACPFVVVSHQFWRDRLGASPDAVGRPLRVNRRPLIVIGVASPEFRGTVTALRYDLWIPLTMSAEIGLGSRVLTDRGIRGLDLLARLQPGVTIPQCRTEAAAVAERLAAAYPDLNRNIGATVVPIGEMRSGAASLLRAPLRILLAVSLVVLLIVCGNVANLLLARSVARSRELNVRLALGASHARVAQQLIAETLPLAVAGTVAALPLAYWMGDMLPLLVPQIGVPVVAGFAWNLRVLLFCILACIGVTLLSSLGPVLLSYRADVNEALKEGGRTGAHGRRSHRAQRALVIVQVALASLSLVSAGLFLRSFENARRIPPGFDPGNVLLARFYVSGAQYTPAQMHQFFQRLQERMAAQPGVLSVSYGDYAPLGSDAGPYNTVQVEGYEPSSEDRMMISGNLIAPGYLDTLRIPLVEGREFTRQDSPDRPRVVIVSQAFARKYYGGASPLGRRVRLRGNWATIVGMARDSKHFHLSEPDRPYFYSPFAYTSNTSQSVYFLVRTAGDARTAIPILRREAWQLDPDAVAMQPMLLKDWTSVTLLPQKLAASLVLALGALSLLLAAIGLYSAMAYAVIQRTQEFGIRMALGASLRHVLRDVLGQSLWLTAAGLAIGLLGALVVTRLIESMLIQVSAADPLTYCGVAFFLVLVALIACAIPARRAARVDPVVAMRHS
jgi:predicted permease